MPHMSVYGHESHLIQALTAFNSNNDQHEVGMIWWKTKMPDIISRTSSTEPFRVLAVGTWDGKPFDHELLEMLSTSQKHVVYTVVEPSQTAVKGFQDLVKYKYSSIEFRWFCMTWQDFQDKEWKKDGSQYNLIHFIHSVYHISSSVEEFRERIRKCFDAMLSAGGALVFFAANYKKKICFLSSVDVEGGLWLAYKYNMILKIASEEGWKVEADEVNYKVDVSKCFDEDSVEGNFLLDFLTQTENFRQNAPREKMETALKYLEAQTDGKSKIVGPCIFDITTIWKEPLPQI